MLYNPNSIPLRIPFAPNRAFNFAKPIKVTNRTTKLTNYQIEVNLNTSNFAFEKARADGADVRFQDANGKALSYWIESWSTTSATIWVKLDELEAYEDRIIWLLYGNADAMSESNGDDTFITYNVTDIQVFYQMDEASWNGTPGEVKDETGVNNGVASGGATTIANGKFKRAGSFDGDNDYVDCGNDPSLNFGTGDFTISTYFKATNKYYAKHPHILSKQNPEQSTEWTLQFVSSNGNLIFRANAIDHLTSNSDYFDDTWHYATVTRNSGTFYMYVDGALEDSKTISLTLTNAEPLRIGARYSAYWGYFDGAIDEVVIYNRALGAGEISTIYDNYMEKMGNYYNIRKWNDSPPSIEVL